jgi:carbon starvation protein
MLGVLIIAISLAFLGLGYIFYGRFVARRLGVDPGRPTPARELPAD